MSLRRSASVSWRRLSNKQAGAICQLLLSLEGTRVSLHRVSVLCFFNFPHQAFQNQLPSKFPGALVDEDGWWETQDKQSCRSPTKVFSSICYQSLIRWPGARIVDAAATSEVSTDWSFHLVQTSVMWQGRLLWDQKSLFDFLFKIINVTF